MHVYPDASFATDKETQTFRSALAVSYAGDFMHWCSTPQKASDVARHGSGRYDDGGSRALSDVAHSAGARMGAWNRGPSMVECLQYLGALHGPCESAHDKEEAF